MFDRIYDTLFHYFALLFPKTAEQYITTFWLKLYKQEADEQRELEERQNKYLAERNERLFHTEELLRKLGRLK